MAKKKINPALTVFVCLLALVIGFAAAFFLYAYIKKPKGGDVYVSGDISFHFMELGNKASGDSIYIKAGNTDILIDAGSVESSTDTTSEYIKRYCTDNVLEYVIVTHADSDHIAGFAGSSSSPSIFDRFTCETVIGFNLTNKELTTASGNPTTYAQYREQLQEAIDGGAKYYTALDCYNNKDGAQRTYTLANGIEMEILYNYYYEHESADENNYSVCVMFNQGDKHFLFTGDLEEDGEERLAEFYDLPEVELFKAGHHGSKTSSTDALLSEIRPKIVCVCCCAGYNQYNAAEENVFPTQAMIDRVSVYTDKVYVTSLYDESAEEGFVSMNGNIVVTSGSGGVTVNCSDNNTLLKDTEWFANNREMPAAWAAALKDRAGRQKNLLPPALSLRKILAKIVQKY